eukprot:1595044-Alexandrium_andersonii.AAC.1
MTPTPPDEPLQTGHLRPLLDPRNSSSGRLTRCFGSVLLCLFGVNAGRSAGSCGELRSALQRAGKVRGALERSGELRELWRAGRRL